MRFQREITAAVLIPAVLAVLVAAPLWAWALLVAAATTLALLEFYRLIEAAGWIVPKSAGVGLFLALVAAAYLASLLMLVVLAGVALFALPALVMFASPREAVLLASSASSVFATLYVALGAGAMVGLRAHGWKPVLFVLATVWASDSAAYYVGRKWGRRKLAPVVSPKKTVEGLFGQLAGGRSSVSRSPSFSGTAAPRVSAPRRAFSSRASPSSGISSNPRSREAAP